MSAPVGIQKTGRTRRAALRRAALLRAQGRTRPLCTQPLGDVVAERGPNRIFNRLRGNTEGSAVVALIRSAPSVLGTEVGINIEFRVCMELQFPESMSRADQGLRAVGTERQIGQLRRAVTADAITSDSFDGEVQLFREQGHAQA